MAIEHVTGDNKIKLSPDLDAVEEGTGRTDPKGYFTLQGVRDWTYECELQGVPMTNTIWFKGARPEYMCVKTPNSLMPTQAKAPKTRVRTMPHGTSFGIGLMVGAGGGIVSTIFMLVSLGVLH